jgi:hypothetical protein
LVLEEEEYQTEVSEGLGMLNSANVFPPFDNDGHGAMSM